MIVVDDERLPRGQRMRQSRERMRALIIFNLICSVTGSSKIILSLSAW